MATIINFPQKEQYRLRGEARCFHCTHTWEAVCPVGTISSLECPECHTEKGVLIGLVEIPDNAARFVCNCGCDLYYILVDGCQCLLCGKIVTGF